jgi:hypothetical protein
MKRSLRNGIGAVAAGALLLVAAVSGFIIVPEHKPHTVTTYRQVPKLPYPQLTPGAVACSPGPVPSGVVPVPSVGYCEVGVRTLVPSHTLYDLLKVAPWALAIVGALLAVIGLIRYARAAGERVP